MLAVTAPQPAISPIDPGAADREQAGFEMIASEEQGAVACVFSRQAAHSDIKVSYEQVADTGSSSIVRTQLARPPGPALRPFVQMLWAVDDLSPGILSDRREHVLPTGQMHLVFRLGEDRLRLFSDEDDRRGQIAGDALIGGARDRYYAREISGLQCSVGVQLYPGAAEAVFGVPAGEFTGRHTPLDDVWGRQVSIIRERLADEKSLAGRLDTLEAILAARISGTRAMHPAVARALQYFSVTSDVGRVVRESGYSHRTLISQFRRSVGLTPKEYTRVLRLQRAIRRMPRVRSLAELAAEAGYSDQAHLSREFRAFAGLTPGDYRRIAPEAPHHVRMADPVR